MNQVTGHQENPQSIWPTVFHEGHRDILDDIEDLDNIFGIGDEKNDGQYEAKEVNKKKIKESRETKKQKDQKKLFQ